jgi:lysophospholipase L1-like esterase
LTGRKKKVTVECQGIDRFRSRLEAGEPVLVVVLGDSIARGDEAPTPSCGFVSLWADGLHARFGARILVANLSLGGATIKDARRMLRMAGLSSYDLLVIAVGVNDAANGMSVATFRRTLRAIAKACEGAGAEMLVVTPLNPTNADVAPYVQLMRSSGLPIADVNAGWNDRPLANGVNHPDAAGHRYYADVLLAVVDGREPGG